MSKKAHWNFQDVELITYQLSIGTLVGALINGPIADFTGRKLAIVIMNVVFVIGMIVQITSSTKWYQVAIGRLVAGLGVGGLSVLTPMYQSETAPKQIRGALVRYTAVKVSYVSSKLTQVF